MPRAGASVRSVKAQQVRRLGDVVEHVVGVPERPVSTAPRDLWWESRGRDTGESRPRGAGVQDLGVRLAGDTRDPLDASHLDRFQDIGARAALMPTFDMFLSLLWGFVLLVLISVDGWNSDLPLLVVVLQVLGSASSRSATAGP